MLTSFALFLKIDGRSGAGQAKTAYFDRADFRSISSVVLINHSLLQFFEDKVGGLCSHYPIRPLFVLRVVDEMGTTDIRYSVYPSLEN